jgi:hypothetical protein
MTIDIELWKFLLVQGGLALVTGAAVMAWRGERAERQDYFKQLLDLGKRSVEADFTVAASMEKLREAVLARRD